LKLISGPVTSCSLSWIQVFYKGITGWAAVQYVTPCNPLNPSSVNITIPDTQENGTVLEAVDSDFNYKNKESSAPSLMLSIFFFSFCLIVLSYVI